MGVVLELVEAAVKRACGEESKGGAVVDTDVMAVRDVELVKFGSEEGCGGAVAGKTAQRLAGFQGR